MNMNKLLIIGALVAPGLVFGADTKINLIPGVQCDEATIPCDISITFKNITSLLPIKKKCKDFSDNLLAYPNVKPSACKTPITLHPEWQFTINGFTFSADTKINQKSPFLNNSNNVMLMHQSNCNTVYPLREKDLSGYSQIDITFTYKYDHHQVQFVCYPSN